MIAIYHQDYDALLDMVSRYGMSGVVEALAQVASTKAKLHTERRDVEGAKEWTLAAQTLDKVAAKLAT